MATVGGFLAIFFLSSGVAYSRNLSESLGVICASSAVLVLGGIIGYIYESCRIKRFVVFSDFPLRYLLVGGLLFAVSQSLFYLAIGLSATRQQAIIVGLINYSWCGLSIVLSVPMLRNQPRWFLGLGCFIAFLGIIVATIRTGGTFTLAQGPIAPYILAVIDAIAWALYSNLCRKWSRDIHYNASPLFLLASGIALASMQFFFKEQPSWNLSILLNLAYMAVVPVSLAFILWDIAMRKGNHSLVLSFSFFIPILSTLFSCYYLRIHPESSMWLGTAMVLVGSLLCRYSIKKPSQAIA